MNLKNYTAAFIIAILISSGCSSQKQKVAGGYDLNNPVKIDLPKEVDQISGIAYSKDNFVFAVDDDNSSLYKIQLQDKRKIENWRIGKGNDCEDVVMVNDKYYVLQSSGSILGFSLPVQEAAEYQPRVKGRNEFESLFLDATTGQLVTICKECSEDKKGETSAYAYDIKRNAFVDQPVFKIAKKEIEAKLGKDIERFKPSGAAINPLTKELFIVSSVNKLLVVLDVARKVKYVHELKSQLFKQPEGITFTPQGDMLISNEASSKTPANILIFKKQ